VSEQAKASKHRLQDAEELFGEGRWRGALYLGGYAVECLLKARLMQIYGCRHLGELEEELLRRGVLGADQTVFTHHLERLLRLTGAQNRLRQNHTGWRSFVTANRWIPAWRYSSDLSNENDAEDFLNSVRELLRWIENNT
jgi:HEPN domain-containing protein